ncbi:MAG: BrnT family toxin [Candidatus Omnitrophica bacterium]|nr:BrnT family toxin [Candidatus Omnitrophota bacterium]
MAELPDFSRIEGFDWGKGSADKNWRRHRVAFHECEEVFFREPVIAADAGHSTVEVRYFAFGRTVRGRRLTVVFTVRGQRVRVISARDMNRKERRRHVKA